jgi:hypothetical protein
MIRMNPMHDTVNPPGQARTLADTFEPQERFVRVEDVKKFLKQNCFDMDRDDTHIEVVDRKKLEKFLDGTCERLEYL